MSNVIDPKHYDPSWRRVWAATNSKVNPSDQMPTDTAAKKVLAIAAYTQEMTLAALLHAQSLGTGVDSSVLSRSREALESIYLQAGLVDPVSSREILESHLIERLRDSKEQLQTSEVDQKCKGSFSTWTDALSTVTNAIISRCS